MNQFELLRNAYFEIGGNDQLAATRSEYPEPPTSKEKIERLETDWEKILADMHARTGTLLKTNTVSFLLGAGASKECGGPLIGKIPLEVEKKLLDEGITGNEESVIRIYPWLKCFYLAASHTAGKSADIPLEPREKILERKKKITEEKADCLPVNFEELLGLLYRWRLALPSEGGHLKIKSDPEIDLKAEVIEKCLSRATSALVDLCQLPAPATSGFDTGFNAYKNLLRKVLTRPLNLKRANIFTLNYDTLVEQAADAQGVVLVDGFIGLINRTFRPEAFDQDIYFPAETTEGHVHRLDRVLHIYKLHGSINWIAEEPSWENPYGIRAQVEKDLKNGQTLIYPTPAKWGELLGMPYAELLRRFAVTVVRPQSVLFVLGYGFGDEHIRAIVRQALGIPSFTLVIVDPKPESDFVKTLNEQKDQRVWIFSGETFGKFTGFVQYVLADLQDENIRRKVMETHRSLKKNDSANSEGGTKDA